MNKIAVVLYGPPGSGKGTQADLLAQKLGLIHFDTGKFLENLVHDPARQKEKLIQKEKKNFDTGKLLTPSFVFREVASAAKKIADADMGIVFSGSPRTMYEAEHLLPVLNKLYGKKIFVFILEIPEATSVKRNGSRLVCVECKKPLLTAYYPSKKPKHCSFCAGPFYRRTLDDPKVIKVRLKEYRTRTMPIFDYVKSLRMKVHPVSGVSAPYKVFEKIYKILNKDFGGR